MKLDRHLGRTFGSRDGPTCLTVVKALRLGAVHKISLLMRPEQRIRRRIVIV